MRGRNGLMSGNLSTSVSAASATVAPGLRWMTNSDVPARSRRIAKSLTLTRMARARRRRLAVVARGLVEADDGDLVPVGELQHLLLLEDHRLARLQHEAAG